LIQLLLGVFSRKIIPNRFLHVAILVLMTVQNTKYFWRVIVHVSLRLTLQDSLFVFHNFKK